MKLLHLIKQDFRYGLWPFLISILCLFAYALAQNWWGDAFYENDPLEHRLDAGLPLIIVFYLLSSALFVSRVVHKDSLTDFDAFWLSKPIDESELFFGKAIVLGLGLVLPPLLLHGLFAISAGVFPFGGLLLRQLVIVLIWFGPVVAYSVHTKNLGSMLLAMLATSAALFLGLLSMDLFGIVNPKMSLGGVPLLVGFLVYATCLGVAIYLQCIGRRRHASFAFLALAGGVPLIMLVQGAEAYLGPSAQSSANQLVAESIEIDLEKLYLHDASGRYLDIRVDTFYNKVPRDFLFKTTGIDFHEREEKSGRDYYSNNRYDWIPISEIEEGLSRLSDSELVGLKRELYQEGKLSMNWPSLYDFRGKRIRASMEERASVDLRMACVRYDVEGVEVLNIKDGEEFKARGFKTHIKILDMESDKKGFSIETSSYRGLQAQPLFRLRDNEGENELVRLYFLVDEFGKATFSDVTSAFDGNLVPYYGISHSREYVYRVSEFDGELHLDNSIDYKEIDVAKYRLAAVDIRHKGFFELKTIVPESRIERY